MSELVYPLLQILEVKQKRVEDAEKVVKEKKEALLKEEEKLKEREEERKKVKDHYDDKLKQLRTLLDEGGSSPKIQQMKVYLKTVDEKLKVEDKKVADQKIQVENAEKNLEAAKKDLQAKRQEVDKLLAHKEDWEKEAKKEREIVEGREQDEIGTIIHSSQHRKSPS